MYNNEDDKTYNLTINTAFLFLSDDMTLCQQYEFTTTGEISDDGNEEIITTSKLERKRKSGDLTQVSTFWKIFYPMPFFKENLYNGNKLIAPLAAKCKIKIL